MLRIQFIQIGWIHLKCFHHGTIKKYCCISKRTKWEQYAQEKNCNAIFLQSNWIAIFFVNFKIDADGSVQLLYMNKWMKNSEQNMKKAHVLLKKKQRIDEEKKQHKNYYVDILARCICYTVRCMSIKCIRYKWSESFGLNQVFPPLWWYAINGIEVEACTQHEMALQINV